MIYNGRTSINEKKKLIKAFSKDFYEYFKES